MDLAGLHALNLLASSPLRIPLAFAAGPVAPWVYGLAVVTWMLWRRDLRLLLVLGVSVAVTDLTCARLVKPAFERLRPCATETLDLPVPCGSGGAMPSAHAANTAAVAAAAASPLLAVVSLVVGGSRVAAGQHWPSDVAVGWGIGVGIGSGLRALARRQLGWT